MSQSSSGNGAGIGFPAVLTIAFIILKLTHVIAWSWFWVLAPLWISLGLVFVIGVLILIGAAIVKKLDHHV